MRWMMVVGLTVLTTGCRGECPPAEPRQELVACSSKEDCRVETPCDCRTSHHSMVIATSAEWKDVADAYGHCCPEQRCGLLVDVGGPSDEDLDCVDGRCVFPSSGSSWSVSSESE